MKTTFEDAVRARLRDPVEQMTDYEAIALMEYLLRNLVFVAMRANFIAGGPEVRLPSAPGFGTWLSLVKELSRSLALSEIFPSVEAALNSVEERIIRRQSSDLEHLTIKQYRDHLFHGGAPLGGTTKSDPVHACRTMASSLQALLTNLLSDCQIIQSAERSRPHTVIATIDGSQIDLSPLIIATPESSWLAFSQVDGSQISYHGPTTHPKVFVGNELLSRAITGHLRSRKRDVVFDSFVSDARYDTAAFGPENRQPFHTTQGNMFRIEWWRTTSEEDEYRDDLFRLGRDDRREWNDGSEWRAYSDFIKEISNFRTVKQRLASTLAIDNEEAHSPGSMPSGQFIAPTLSLLSSNMNSTVKKIEMIKLIEMVNERVSTRGESTDIFFVQGQAGIGKTRCLRVAALTAMQSDDSAPIYLFVQAGGISLRDLRTLVSAAVRSTKMLDDRSVRSLARNGLLILIIDGFDELLGGLTYSDPLESLRPWIESLGGRGLMLVSARSSYFFNHYRAAMDRTEGLPVAHQVLRLEPWTRSQLGRFLEQCGVRPGVVRGLRTDERDLVRVPFFARVLANAVVNELPLDQGIGEMMVSAYLDRELSKLGRSDAHTATLMSRTELEEFFVNVADLMTSGSLGGEDLVAAAQNALGASELDEVSGLSDRITALCALAVEESAGTSVFSFEHELYFDYFFAQAFIRQLEVKELPPGMGLAGREPLREWAADLTVAAAADRTVELLHSSENDRSPDNTTQRQSAGSLFAALSRRGMCPISVSRATIDELHLVLDSLITLDDVQIDRLVVSRSHPSGELRVSNSLIRSLELDPTSTLVATFDWESVPTELMATDLITGRDQVAGVIEDLGGVVEGRTDTTNSLLADVEGFLERLARLEVVQPVLTRDSKLPNDQRLQWANDRAESWQKFVVALDDLDYVVLKNIAAQGRSMVRMVWRVPLSQLVDAGSPERAMLNERLS